MIDEKDYGEKFNDHLLEQYKTYVEMTDRISGRRSKANQFYISMLSALLAVITFVIGQKNFNIIVLNILFLTVSIIGIALCTLWWTTINSYKQLNKLKFTVILEMEKKLPYACFAREWDIEKDIKYEYFRLTRVEKYIPFCMVVPYILLFFYSLIYIIK